MTIATILQSAGLRLHHAMNLSGFSDYVSRAAVLSREELFAVNPQTPPFYSDANDRAHGVFSRTFGNLLDFGGIYARGRLPVTPNIYGPIQVVFPPSIWSLLDDLVLTRNSIVQYRADWRGAALSENEIADLAAYVRNNSGRLPAWGQYIEVSCSNPNIPLIHCESIMVEPVTLLGESLADTVRRLVAPLGLSERVYERGFSRVENRAFLQKQVDELAVLTFGSDANLVFTRVPTELAGAPTAAIERFQRWATNFYRGTVLYRRSQRATPPAASKAPSFDDSDDVEHDFDERAAFTRLYDDAARLGDAPSQEQIVELFRAHFMDPANGVPHDSGEGGYQYYSGGPYDPRDVLNDLFADAIDALSDDGSGPHGSEDARSLASAVDGAVDELYSESGDAWVFKDQY